MTAAPPSAGRHWGFLSLVIAIDLIALAIAFWPVLLLTVGLQAIADSNGWWSGTPTAETGEEVFAALVGAVGLLLMLVVTAIPVALLARRHSQPVLRSIARNTLYFLGACLAIGVLTVLL